MKHMSAHESHRRILLREIEMQEKTLAKKDRFGTILHSAYEIERAKALIKTLKLGLTK